MEKIKNLISSLFTYKEDKKYDFNLLNNNSSFNNEILIKNLEGNDSQTIYNSLNVSLEYVKAKYNYLINSDIKIREFYVMARNKRYSAFLLYIDGLANSDSINHFILKPLMLKNTSNSFNNSEEIVSTAISNNISVKKVKKFNLEDYIYNSLMPQNDVKKFSNFSDVFTEVNMGSCALFIDTLNIAYTCDIKKYEKRSITTSQNETIIRGSQEAFIENLRTNTSLIRRMINNENLTIESTTVGKVSKTKCAICYIDNLTNKDLIAEVKFRINNLDVDYLISSGQLEALITDNPSTSLPQVISTERLDRAVNYLLEGRVIIILNGSPYSLIIPGTFWDFLSSTEDSNLNYKFGTMLKIVRIIGLIISLLLPGIYMAITNFHLELIPTELLFSIVSSRTNVPFPILFEVLLMEISLELIREAGIRVPSPMGQTIGIIGGLVLSEAAVSANIVSPILIIIVAITGLSSFAMPDFSLSFHIRITRFLYIFLGYFAGFLGISLGLFIHLAILSNVQSYSVPYLTPYIPASNKDGNSYLVKPFWKKEKRLDTLGTFKPNKEEHISMKWKN